jgi:hypothetical protein
MFRWFKQSSSKVDKRQAQMDAALKLMDSYGTVLERHEAVVSDEMELPASKDQIVSACKIAMLCAKNQNTRDAIEACWYSLCFFQQGVGRIGIRMPRYDEITDKRGERIINLQAIVIAEGAKRRADISAFKLQISD